MVCRADPFSFKLRREDPMRTQGKGNEIACLSNSRWNRRSHLCTRHCCRWRSGWLIRGSRTPSWISPPGARTLELSTWRGDSYARSFRTRDPMCRRATTSITLGGAPIGEAIIRDCGPSRRSTIRMDFSSSTTGWAARTALYVSPNKMLKRRSYSPELSSARDLTPWRVRFCPSGVVESVVDRGGQ